MASGGVYIPPHMRRAAEEDDGDATDLATPAGQREYWEALRRGLTGAVNKCTRANIAAVAAECLGENVVRGRGLFARAVVRAQQANPEMTPVFAALVACVNAKMPEVGELVVRRLVLQYKRIYRRKDHSGLATVAEFLAELCVQRVQHELLLLKILASLLCTPTTPTADDIDIATAVFKRSFKFLEVVNGAAFHAVLEPVRSSGRFRVILIDCPPALGMLSMNSLAAADFLLITLQCEYMAMEGLGQILRNVDRLKAARVNDRLELGGVVMTMYDARTNLARQVVEEVRQHLPEKVFGTVIPRTVRLSEAPSFGQPITAYDPEGPGTEAYRNLATEVIARFGLK